jgi:hypothetical protein
MRFPIHPLPLLDVIVSCGEPRFACYPHRSSTLVVILFVQLFRLNPSGNSQAKLNRRCIVKVAIATASLCLTVFVTEGRSEYVLIHV